MTKTLVLLITVVTVVLFDHFSDCQSQATCLSGWQIYNENCYLFNSTVIVKQTFAEEDCVSKGAHLTSINDASELAFINSSRVTNAMYWIGLMKITASVDGVTYWLDNSASTYRAWATGQPNEAITCVLLGTDGLFYDSNCSVVSAAYICESSAYTATTPAITTAASTPSVTTTPIATSPATTTAASTPSVTTTPIATSPATTTAASTPSVTTTPIATSPATTTAATTLAPTLPITDGRSTPTVQSSSTAIALPESPRVGAIAGGVIGGILGAAVLVGLVLLVVIFMRRRKSGDKQNLDGKVSFKLSASKKSSEIRNVRPISLFPVDDADTKVQLIHLEDYVTKQEAIDAQYEELPKDDSSKSITGSLPENKKKNRFVNVLPYDESRVKIMVNGEEAYINASYIMNYNGDGIAFIAAQAPKVETAVEFWEMIWQQNVSGIVALVLVKEDGKSKCHPYWPESVDGVITFGRITVTLLEIDVYSEFVKRKLSFHASGELPRNLTQFQYLEWPDKGVPEHVWSLNAFRNRVRSFMPKSKSSEGRLLVHCSAGVGRTGTFIALDILLDEAVQTGSVDVFDVVKNLRLQRMSCVQTREQYRLLYLAVLDAYVTGVTARPSGEVNNLVFTTQNENSTTFLESEYQNISQLRPAIPPNKKLEALKPMNLDKNRRIDVVPLSDSSRCLLPVSFNGSDYINASITKGYKMPPTYILTQLPLAKTVNDFWKMVLVEKSSSLVLLQTGSTNNPPFYPTRQNEMKTYGSTKVTLKSTESVGTKSIEIVLRTMEVVGKAGDQLEFRIHEFSSWKQETDLPDVDHVLEMINLVNNWEHRQPQRSTVSTSDSDLKPSIIVQCLDGATRSGLYAATSLAIDRLKCDNELDVFLSCRYITSVRPHTIISQAQYEFIYRAAVRSLTWSPAFETLTPAGQNEHLYHNIHLAGPSTTADNEENQYANMSGTDLKPKVN